MVRNMVKIESELRIVTNGNLDCGHSDLLALFALATGERFMDFLS